MNCAIVDVGPVLLALHAAEVPRGQVPARIRAMYDVAYAWLRQSGLRQAGHNYAIYDECRPDRLRVRVGFPMAERFADTAELRCVEFAPGRAACAVHVGPYGRMGETYALLEAWCASQGLARSGVSWEVYGDWTEDATKLETSIYLGLRSG
jgi:effector-binding domain-containing protein